MSLVVNANIRNFGASSNSWYGPVAVTFSSGNQISFGNKNFSIKRYNDDMFSCRGYQKGTTIANKMGLSKYKDNRIDIIMNIPDHEDEIKGYSYGFEFMNNKDYDKVYNFFSQNDIKGEDVNHGFLDCNSYTSGSPEDWDGFQQWIRNGGGKKRKSKTKRKVLNKKTIQKKLERKRSLKQKGKGGKKNNTKKLTARKI